MGFVEPTKFTWVNDRATGRQVKKGNRDTKWKARYTDPAGKDRSKTFARKADAEKFLERIGTDGDLDAAARDPVRKVAWCTSVGPAGRWSNSVLTSWLFGVFRRIRALLLGEFPNCFKDAGEREAFYSRWREKLAGLGIPVLTDLPFGHAQSAQLLPLGVKAEIDTKSAAGLINCEIGVKW